MWSMQNSSATFFSTTTYGAQFDNSVQPLHTKTNFKPHILNSEETIYGYTGVCEGKNMSKYLIQVLCVHTVSRIKAFHIWNKILQSQREDCFVSHQSEVGIPSDPVPQRAQTQVFLLSQSWSWRRGRSCGRDWSTWDGFQREQVGGRRGSGERWSGQPPCWTWCWL